MGCLAGLGLWSAPEAEKTSVTNEKKWTLCSDPPPPKARLALRSRASTQQQPFRKGTLVFRAGLWHPLCCGWISGFGQLIRKFLRLGEHPNELFCFKEGCNKKTGLIKIGLIEVRRSHLQGALNDWDRVGARL